MSIAVILLFLCGVSLMLYVAFVALGDRLDWYVSSRIIAAILTILIWFAVDMTDTPVHTTPISIKADNTTNK